MQLQGFVHGEVGPSRCNPETECSSARASCVCVCVCQRHTTLNCCPCFLFFSPPLSPHGNALRKHSHAVKWRMVMFARDKVRTPGRFVGPPWHPAVQGWVGAAKPPCSGPEVSGVKIGDVFEGQAELARTVDVHDWCVVCLCCHNHGPSPWARGGRGPALNLRVCSVNLMTII